MTFIAAALTPEAVTMAGDGLIVEVEEETGRTERLVDERAAKARSRGGFLVGVTGPARIEGVDASSWCLDVLVGHGDPGTAPYALARELSGLDIGVLAITGGVDAIVGLIVDGQPQLCRISMGSTGGRWVSVEVMTSGHSGTSIGDTEFFDLFTRRWDWAGMRPADARRGLLSLVEARVRADEPVPLESTAMGGRCQVVQLSTDGSTVDGEEGHEGVKTSVVGHDDDKTRVVLVGLMYGHEAEELEAFGRWAAKAGPAEAELRDMFRRRQITAQALVDEVRAANDWLDLLRDGEVAEYLETDQGLFLVPPARGHHFEWLLTDRSVEARLRPGEVTVQFERLLALWAHRRRALAALPENERATAGFPSYVEAFDPICPLFVDDDDLLLEPDLPPLFRLEPEPAAEGAQE